MTSESLREQFTECYVRECGLPFFRGECNGEYFLAAGGRGRRLHLRLEPSHSFSDVVTIRLTPSRLHALPERSALTAFVDKWNHQNHQVSAILHVGDDSRHVGVSVRRSHWIPDAMPYDDFASRIDHAIAAGFRFFDELALLGETQGAENSPLRDAS